MNPLVKRTLSNPVMIARHETKRLVEAHKLVEDGLLIERMSCNGEPEFHPTVFARNLAAYKSYGW